MADELDRDAAAAFEALGRIEPPDLTARIFGGRSASRSAPPLGLVGAPRSTPRRRWSVGIAAAVALFGGGLAVGLLVARDGPPSGPTPLVDPPPSASPPTSPSTRTVPPTSTVVGDSGATVTPIVVRPGGRIAVTPDGVVEGMCTRLALVYRGEGGEPLAQLGPDGTWTPIGRDDPPATWPACLELPSSATVEYQLPGGIGLGRYVICIAGIVDPEARADADPRGCGSFTVSSTGESGPAEASPSDPVAVALEQFGAAVAAAPAGAASLDGATWCGAERRVGPDPEGGQIDDEARRCFIDAHLAVAPAIFLTLASTTEGDPIVEVYRTLADGTVEVFTDATRDAFGSGRWESQSCARLATKFPGGPDGNPPTTFGCTDDGGDVLSPLYTAMPSWFTSREVLPLCGYAVRLVDVDTVQRDCFAQAIADRRPAEFAYVDVSGGARTARWFRVTTAGAFEVIEQTITDEAGAVWQRYACTVIDTVDGADPGWVDVPFLDPTHCNVGVDAVPPSATSTPATIAPTAPPGTIRGDAAPPPT